MMSPQPTYLSQGVDYLGFLSQQLGDLAGKTTLAHELIQNADDVRDDDGRLSATRIAFDVTDTALAVSNDAVFREIDFQRMRGPCLRVVIDANLWVGSGQPIPRAWADKAGVNPGHKKNIGNGYDNVTVSWVGSEPTLGSLRALALSPGWPQEGIGFLILDEDRLATCWRPLPPEPSNDALKAATAMNSLFALPENPNKHPLDGAFWTILGARLGLEPSHQVPGLIVSRLRSRREKITDPYVEALWEALLISESRGLVVQMDI